MSKLIHIGFGNIVHGRVGVSVGVVAGVASVNTSDEHAMVEVAVIVEALAFVVDGLFNLRSQFCQCAGGETAKVAVGDVVAVGPSDVI